MYQRLVSRFGFLSAVEENVLRKLLVKAPREVEFSFADKMFSQVDSIAMGSSLGLTLPNTFVGHHESVASDQCTRYVTYSIFPVLAMFETKDLGLDFMCLLIGMHLSLTFTMEEETDNRLPFLDVMFVGSGNSFLSTI